MPQYPNDRRYTKDHEWAKNENGTVRVGITAYAVDQLGDVTLVDLAATGTEVKSHGRFGDIESVKAVSELFAPVSGQVAEVNPALESSPELVNEAPYDKGWMITIKASDPAELDGLMDAAAYESYLGTLDH